MSERFLDSVDAAPATKIVADNADEISAREKLAIVHDVVIPNPSGEGLYQRHKVLVVPGDPNSDLTIITPPAWTDGPDTPGRMRILSTLAELTGATMVTPLFPGMGEEGAGYSRLTKVQRGHYVGTQPEGSLLAGSYQNVASSQWAAMQMVEGRDNNNAGMFLSGENRQIVVFGHSMGTNGAAGLLATAPEEIQSKIAGVILSETPDIRDTSLLDSLSQLAIATGYKRLGLGLNMASLSYRADLVARLKASEKSPDQYGIMNNQINTDVELDWERQSKKDFNRMLIRDRVALVVGPIAMGLGALQADIRDSHQAGQVEWRRIPVAIYRGGIRSTTLDDRQAQLQELLTRQAGAEIVRRQTFEGEDHSYADSLILNLYMVLTALEEFGLSNSSR